jgi:hypothetical protein
MGNMNWKRYTIIFIVATFVSIAAYDAITIHEGGLETSISHTMIVWSYKYPIFTFLMGFIMGHLFWRLRDTPETTQISKGLEK